MNWRDISNLLSQNGGVTTLLSTIFSTVVASVVAGIVARGANHAEERRSMHDQIIKLIDLAITYPFLEDDAICEQWPNPQLSKDDKLRYDTYCCHVFNVMENVSDFCNADRQKMRKMLHVEELIWRHRCWWKNESENQKGYNVGFRNFVDAIIKSRATEVQSESKSNSR